jgi:cleavage and polyadenylation specificity factor subunit 1
MVAAFEAAKTAVCEATKLDHPDPDAEVNLVVDASDTHIGAVLQQRTAAGWKPLSFFSRKLSPTEARYSAFDRELWAIFSGIRHYRYLLEGRSFHVLTDHKPLTTALHRVSEPWSAKQQRQLVYIAEFTADIRHIPGKQNVVADTYPVAAAPRLASPSRVLVASPSAPTPGTGPTGAETRAGLHTIIRPGPQSLASATLGCHGGDRPLDYGQMAAAQAECTSCKSVQAGPSSLVFQEFDLGRGKLLCDVSTGAVRPRVPLTYRRQVFQAFHNIAHPGIRATRRLLAARFVWPRMAADVAAWCRQCIGCARGKLTRP